MKFRHTGTKERPVRTALVLSGGGAKGAYQVGVIRELLKQGIKPDLVTGSSIGAFNGALLSELIFLQLRHRDLMGRIEHVWQQVDDFLTLNWAGFLKNVNNPLNIPSIFTNRAIKKILNEYIPEQRQFSDFTDCQLSVTGTNLDKKDKQVFDFNSDVPVDRAVLASMAFPVAYPSVNIDGDYYIDGGFLDNAPLKEAILWGARRIYAVFLTPLSIIEGGEDKQCKVETGYSALKVIDNVIDLATNRLLYGDLHNAEKINRLIKLINRYEEKIPADFLEKLYKLFGLKTGDGKRIIRIKKIAPDKVLKPPGTIGFDKGEVLKGLIKRGEKDARKCL